MSAALAKPPDEYAFVPGKCPVAGIAPCDVFRLYWPALHVLTTDDKAAFESIRTTRGGPMGLSIRNLDSPLGAEVSGVDLSMPLASDEVEAIEEAWRTRLVIVAPGQRLSDPQLLAFSRYFGELDPPGPNPYGEPFNKQFPEINVISNVVENGKPIGNLGDGEAVWHADMTYVDVPPKAAMLHALEVPPRGGNTYFADMFAAYATLPAALKRAAEGKIAVHDASRNSAGFLRKGYKDVTDVRETVGARHPLVRTDAKSGRKALFLGRRPNAYVLGLEVAESEALLDALWAHATQPRFAMCHAWQAGDLLMWNNLAVLHRRDPFDPAARRVMHRTQIKGHERIA
jgi:taurine dioxygenase